MRRLVVASVASAFAFACSACEAPPPPQKPIDGNAGTLTWGVGSTKGELRLTRVENSLEDGVLHIRAWGPVAVSDPAGNARIPVVLHGSMPVDRDLEAGSAEEFGMIATIPWADLGGPEPVEMLKLVARDVDGVTAPWTCTTEGRREIVCNSAQVVPSVPKTGAFRAVFGFN